MRANAARRRWLFSLHRTVGVTAALFLVLLTISGLLLNHGETLQLNQRLISNPSVLSLYNISVPDKTTSFKVADRYITQLGQRLYFDTTEIADDVESLIGGVSLHDTIVVAVTGRLLLLNAEGQLIETLDGSSGVPAGMRRIGLSDSGALAVEAAHGIYQVDLDDLEWQESRAGNGQWLTPVTLPTKLASALAAEYRGAGLSVERLLLDLHSGRIGGALGVWIVDATGILVLMLAASGLWIWTLRNR